MQEVTLKQGNMAVTLSLPEGESREEFIELISTAISWIYNETILLDECELEEYDEPIFCEGEEPKEEREIEGL